MEALTISKVFQVSAEKIWDAITIPEEMKHWYFTIRDFDLKEGAVFTFYEVETGGAFLHRCMIRSVIPQQKFEHTWEHPSHSQGISVLTWDIQAMSENVSKLTLTHAGTENFADGGPEFATENYVVGWKEIIEYSLRNYLY
ncbi:MAG TPA: SRPBCC domain-containing protein, partial [Dyadobacter sp.]|nr:SRPBCC domain-containing protein [Dyadobacter sp.]